MPARAAIVALALLTVAACSSSGATSTDGGADLSAAAPDGGNTLCRPTAPNCGELADGGSPCCPGTICTIRSDGTSTVVTCTHDLGGACVGDGDCAVGLVCGAGVCAYPPKCAMADDDCTAVDVTTGCCDSLATCPMNSFPHRCCRSSQVPCTSGSECCFGLSCSDGGVCTPPTCIATHDNTSCTVFPGTPCCDGRLTCVAANGNPAACCGLPGTVVDADAGDVGICCYGTTTNENTGVTTCAPKPGN